MRETIKEYDLGRASSDPYASQRLTEEFGEAQVYGWSDDKTRQYSRPERAGFGEFVRAIGFRLD